VPTKKKKLKKVKLKPGVVDTTVILALQRLRQEDQEFKASLELFSMNTSQICCLYPEFTVQFSIACGLSLALCLRVDTKFLEVRDPPLPPQHKAKLFMYMDNRPLKQLCPAPCKSNRP
jgi:hypothetical protein